MSTTLNYNYWLDEFNDYMRLYEMFGDEYYLVEASEILTSLKMIVKRTEMNQKFSQLINACDKQKFRSTL